MGNRRGGGSVRHGLAHRVGPQVGVLQYSHYVNLSHRNSEAGAEELLLFLCPEFIRPKEVTWRTLTGFIIGAPE
jgi:hypothetical protein